MTGSVFEVCGWKEVCKGLTVKKVAKVQEQLFGRAGLELLRRPWIGALSWTIEARFRVFATYKPNSRQGSFRCPSLELGIEHLLASI
jgi:hypothetical protein